MLNRGSAKPGASAATKRPHAPDSAGPRLVPLMDFGRSVSLVPNSGVQFMDFGFRSQDLAGVRRRFFEEVFFDPDGTERSALHSIVLEDSVLRHPLTLEPLLNDDTLTVTGKDALKPFLNQWLPIPFMRVVGKDEAGRAQLDEGPANWARIYVTAPAAPGMAADAMASDAMTALGGMAAKAETSQTQHYRVVVAIDTVTAKRAHDNDAAYLAPSPVDVSLASRFAFSEHADDVAWFLAEPWVDAWVEKLFLRSRGIVPNAVSRRRKSQYGLAHVAHYLTFLSVIGDLCALPDIRFIDTAISSKHADPVKVDLVLDIGNSRSMALLMEGDDEFAPQDLQRANVLPLRDLSHPVDIYVGPFDSHVEFLAPSFGDPALSRQSGRCNAFCWPSFARVGAEAARSALRSAAGGLAARQAGASGISSPKRYLWDCRPSAGGWRFAATGAAETSLASGRVSGPLLQYISEDGDVLSGDDNDNDNASLPAVRPKFSRSSLLSFFLCEVLLQAITHMNSPYARARQPRSNAVRQLRRIVVTSPVGMPLEESRLLQKRLDGAVALVWQALGWSSNPELGEAPPQPVVELGIDEAMSSQMVYLYDQLARKFASPIQDYLSLKGKSRGETGVHPVLRIASIDIGAAATGLAIATYSAAGDKALSSTQQLRVGVHVGGDDVMQAVVLNHVIPGIEAHLRAKGHANPQDFLRGLLSNKTLGQSAEDDLFRRRFVAQVLSPMALALVSDYERRSGQDGNERIGRTIADWLQMTRGGAAQWMASPAGASATYAALGKAALGEAGLGKAGPGIDASAAFSDFNARVAAEGIESFALSEAVLSYHAAGLSATICDALGGVLADLSDISCAMDCDLCLVSGRPSHLPDVLDLLLARMPVRPDRIVMMHDYQPGGWYPLRNAAGCIADAKTVVVLGALVHSLADGRLEGFQLTEAKQMPLSAKGRYGQVGEHDGAPQMQRFMGRIDGGGRLMQVRRPTALPDPAGQAGDGGGRGGADVARRVTAASGRLVILEVSADVISGGSPSALADGSGQLPAVLGLPGEADRRPDAAAAAGAGTHAISRTDAVELLKRQDDPESESKDDPGTARAEYLGHGDDQTAAEQPDDHWLDTGVIGPY